MVNPESVMLNLFQHLFRAGMVQHLGFVPLAEILKSSDPDPETSSG